MTVNDINIKSAKFTAHAHIENGQLDEARCIYEKICNADPNDSEASYQLAELLRKLRRYAESIDMLRKTLAVEPNHHNALTLLAHALRATGKSVEAINLFDRALRVKRGIPLNEQTDPSAAFNPPVIQKNEISFCTTGLHKLKHDSEQLRYLISHGLIPESYEEVAQEYDRIRSDYIDNKDPESIIHLTDEQIHRISSTYNMFLYNTYTPSISPGHAVNPACNMHNIENAYNENSPGMAIIDNFLTDEALDKLTGFCLESTIWYGFRYKRGYIGTFMEEGFSCGLLLQIAEELRVLLPSILSDHKLMYCWAYKYDTMHEGINLHADNAAVNVNFWITPNEANLDLNTGGLTVYREEAPLDWDAKNYNRNPSRIREFLDKHNSDSVHIPYQQNRAMIFHSNLFHEADRLHFKEGYENRRINITMLFGRRGG